MTMLRGAVSGMGIFLAAGCGSDGPAKAECAKAGAPVELGTSPKRAQAIALDSTYAYWTTGTQVADAAPSGGAVMRATLAGGAPETLVSEQRLPTAIAVDSQRVYWIDSFSRRIMTVPLAGGDPSVFAQTGQASSLAVDSNNAYWLNFDGPTLSSAVMKASLAGGAAVQLAPAQQRTGSLALDSSSVYWTDVDAVLGSVRLMKVPLDGGTETMVFTTTDTLPGAITVDANNAYLVGATGDGSTGMLEIPLAGGTPKSRGPASMFGVLAVNATSLYWSSYDSAGQFNTVMQASRGGGAAAVVATTPEQISALATHGSSVCWLGNDTSGSVTCLDTCD